MQTERYSNTNADSDTGCVTDAYTESGSNADADAGTNTYTGCFTFADGFTGWWA